MTPSIIWITGASSGIGEALVHRYATKHQDGSNLIIASARRSQLLEEKFSHYPNVRCLSIDVTSKTLMQSAAHSIEKECGYLTHVFVNAGNCLYVDEFPMDTDAFNELLNVNLIGAVNTVNVALPLLEKSPTRGMIIGVSSQVIFAPFTRSEFYGATKAAFDYLMKSLRIDLSAKSIDVSIVYPGFVKTPLTDQNDFDMPFLQSADTAARIIIAAIDRRKLRVVFPKRLYALLKLSDIFPKTWQKIMLKPTKNNQRQ